MKKIKKILAIVLVCVLSFSALQTIPVNASSYPYFFPDNYSQTYYVGDTAYFDYTIMPEYKNEKIHIRVYNQKGKCVASADESFYNYNTYVRNYTVTWNTKGTSTGKYTVVATMEYYTYFDWHECPNEKTINVTVKKKPQNGVSVKRVKNVKGNKIKASWKKVSKAKKYQVKIGSKTYKTKKTSYVSKSLKAEKWYSVKVRAYVNGKWGPWSPKRQAYTMD